MTPNDDDFYSPFGEDPDDFDDDEELTPEEYAAMVTWDAAAGHCEFAAQLNERIAILMMSISPTDAELTLLLTKMVYEQQALAGALLAAGGYGSDQWVHRSLGLPWLGEDPKRGGAND